MCLCFECLKSWICCCCKAGDPDDQNLKRKMKKKKTGKKAKTKDSSKGSKGPDELPIGQQKTISEINEPELLEKYVIQLPKDNCKNANQWLKTRGYQLTDQILGSGGYGTVVKGIKNESDGTSIDIAVKIMDLDPQNKKYKKLFDGLKNELFITDALIREINKIKHNHIIKIYDRFIIENSEDEEHPSEKATKAYFFMELADGDLDNEIEKTGPLEEGLAKRYFAQIVYAIEYMHSLHIAHRDIKLQNFLLVKSKTIPFQKDIKVSDFGLSRVQFKEETGVIYSAKTGGTFMYKSPEILRLQTRVTKKNYDVFKADVWALGVCLYRMLTGEYPFPSSIPPDYEKVIKRQENKEIRFNFPENPKIVITKWAKELIERLLEPNPDKRLKNYLLKRQKWIETEISMTVSGTQTN